MSKTACQQTNKAINPMETKDLTKEKKLEKDLKEYLSSIIHKDDLKTKTEAEITQELFRGIDQFLVNKGYKGEDLSSAKDCLQSFYEGWRAHEKRMRWLEARVPTKPMQLLFPFDEIVEKVRKLPQFPLDPLIYPLLPDIIPHRLRKEDIIEDTITKTGRLLRFQRELRRNIKVAWTFFIPQDELKEGIPTYGELARKAYFAPHAFAVAEQTTNPAFRIVDFLRVTGHSDEEIRRGGEIYRAVANIYRTFAYGSIEIIETINGGKIKKRTIGQFFDKVIIDEQHKVICTPFNQDTEKLYKDWFAGEAKGYISYPVKALMEKLDRYDRNFDDWIVSLCGLEKRVYPLTTKTLLIKKFKLPESKIKKQGWPWAWKWLLDRLQKAKTRGSITDFKRDYRGHPSEFSYIPKWKIKIIPPDLESKEAQIVSQPLYSREFATDQSKEEKLAQEIVGWCMGFHNVRKTPVEIHNQWLKAIKRRGEPRIRAIFEWVKQQPRAHPGMFWDKVKKTSRRQSS